MASTLTFNQGITPLKRVIPCSAVHVAAIDLGLPTAWDLECGVAHGIAKVLGY